MKAERRRAPLLGALARNLSSLTAALGRLLWRGELEYRFTGALTVGTPVGKMRVPFDERGLFHR